LAKHPDAILISLGVGDTTQPISPFITKGLTQAAADLGTQEKYTGYGPEQGIKALREKIASRLYFGQVQPDEIFVSDGTKCDIGRLQTLFGNDVSIAVQDPAYPVYIDGSLIQGISQIVPMPCFPENQFFPDLENTPRTDLIYFCSPNNPTGAVATKSQLDALVKFAKKNRSIILFDAAYSAYIQDSTLPKSIFEIEGARNVAIEMNSFSKLAGFTGIRLGWTVVPKELQYDDGNSIWADWNRLTSTLFNGASNIAQAGGYAALEEIGMQEMASITHYYLENAAILKASLENLGYEVHGGQNAPYLWVRFNGQNSWNVFQRFLEDFHLVTTPGSGFGEGGEEYIRFTAFGQRENILRAAERLACVPTTFDS
jgi:LL-diaminopimelate aminotransferase